MTQPYFQAPRQPQPRDVSPGSGLEGPGFVDPPGEDTPGYYAREMPRSPRPWPVGPNGATGGGGWQERPVTGPPPPRMGPSGGYAPTPFDDEQSFLPRYEENHHAAPLKPTTGDDVNDVSPFALAAYGAGFAAFAGVVLACLAVFAMAGLVTFDLAVGLPACAVAIGCAIVGLLRLRREATARRRVATLVMAVPAILLPVVWVLIWSLVLGF